MELYGLWSPGQPLFTALLAAFAITVLLIVHGRRSRKKNQGPPGPHGWPVLGSLPYLGASPHQNLANLAKKYGPLMSIKLGSRNVVVASSPETAEEFLRFQDRIWSARFANTAARVFSYQRDGVVFADYGTEWRELKKALTSELLSAKRLSEFQASRKEELLKAIHGAITDSRGGTKPVRIASMLRKVVVNNILRMMLNGGSLSQRAKALLTGEFMERMDEVFFLLGAFHIGDYVPWLDWFDPQGLRKRTIDTFKIYDALWQTIIDDHKMKLEAASKAQSEGTSATDTIQDMVDSLLTHSGDSGQHMEDSRIKAVLQDVFFGGADPMCVAIEWALSELLRNPHILEKAQTELDTVVGRNRLVEESDLPNLPYLNAIITETFRLHPVAPLLIPHLSTQDSEIQGFKIPAKTMLLVNVYAIQRDPEVYARPLEFCPERFMVEKSSKDVHGTHFDLLPFGSGRRICPGKGLGLLLALYTLALFIQTCSFRLPANMKPENLDMEDKYGGTAPRTTHLDVVLVPRLPEGVFPNSQAETSLT
ncbi:hypothetical protein R1sor_017100 [Riccia sorocarpa]|uniref:Cytochrome P450 n=1 Tax=Riccia sorocarpa TaxID=122646 RepID=A0ABD3I5U1_9MARC